MIITLTFLTMHQGRIQDFFLGGGTLISCSSSTPINHIVIFLGRIPVVLENFRSSQGGGGGGGGGAAHPLHPPPRSAPVHVSDFPPKALIPLKY